MIPLRGSRRSRAVRAVSASVIAPLAGIAPVDARTLPAARWLIEQGMCSVARPLERTTVDLVRDSGVAGELVCAPDAWHADGVVLYVHGGGFVAGSPRGYRGVASRLSRATRLPVFVVDYRLAPEHPSPAAQHDVAAAYRWLIQQGHRPDRIIVAGDSAGGYLAADLVLANARANVPAPAGAVLFSPMTDLSLDTARAVHPRSRDAILSYALSAKAVRHFSAEPLELRPEPGLDLPPTLIQYGGAEFFAADAVELFARLRVAGAECELQAWPDQMHVFQMMPALVPEAHFAFGAVGRFTDTVLADAAAVAS